MVLFAGLIGTGDDETGVSDTLVLGVVAVRQVVLILTEGYFFIAGIGFIEVQVHHGDDKPRAVIEHGAEGIIVGGGTWWRQGYILVFYDTVLSVL